MESTDNNRNTASVTPTIRPKRKRGRPPKKDWQIEKPAIQVLLRVGYGTMMLAKHYDMTPMGMAFVLRRLGLRTKWQESEHVQH